MRERPDDLRVAKTIKTIHAAFEEMVCEMPYRDITVKGLCERAMVNKKTFYRYYETMDFLLAEFQENMMADYLQRVEGLHVPQDLEAITRAFSHLPPSAARFSNGSPAQAPTMRSAAR